MSGRYDLVIVGLGSGGTVAAELATSLGKRVAAVEGRRIGGDCLWTGCVPSKTLLASAKAAHTLRHADRYGLEPVNAEIDTAPVWRRVRAIRQELAETDDSPERFAALGVDVYAEMGRLVAADTVELESGRRLTGRFVLLCTGSRSAVPAIEGLEQAGYLTTETVWELERAPDSLIVIGGGPVAVELAQACVRLGVQTTMLQRGAGILMRDEPQLAHRLADALHAEGVTLELGVDAASVTVEDGAKVVRGGAGQWRAREVLVATGRTPATDGLGLERLGIATTARGVTVDRSLRTSLKSVYAVGDVAGRFLFTHAAGYEAATAVRNMFFPGSERAPETMPWCTFTDPELAHVGMTEAEARERHGDRAVRVWRHDLARSDRARTDGHGAGELRVVTARGRVVGAHALAPAAGELIHELALAVRERMRLRDLAGLVHIYPTLALGFGQLAGEAATQRARRLRVFSR